MSIQFISDSLGKTTGVFIPINEWNLLKTKFKGIEEETSVSIPAWHEEILSERIEQCNIDKSNTLDFEEALKDIEKDL